MPNRLYVLMLDMVKMDGHALKYLSEDLCNDFEFILAAMRNNSDDSVVLFYASEDLQNNREIVLKAVKNEGWALFFMNHGVSGMTKKFSLRL